MAEVFRLADKVESGKVWSIKDMLKDLVEDDERLERYNKALVVLLDDRDGKYITGFSQAGMRMSECVLLCELGKEMFKGEMG